MPLSIASVHSILTTAEFNFWQKKEEKIKVFNIRTVTELEFTKLLTIVILAMGLYNERDD